MPATLAAFLLVFALPGQRPPNALYCHPPGGVPGTVVRVWLAGADWTPDVRIVSDDPRITIEPVGKPGKVLVPDPPYWTGIRSYLNDPPLAREMPARITIPAKMPEGPVTWRAVNAGGSGKAGVFWVGSGREVEEMPEGVTDAGNPPVTVFGRLGRIEEADRYRFTPREDGTFEAEVFARRLGSDFNAVIEVRDSAGSLVAEHADTLGRDARVRFMGKAGKALELSLRDIDYKGYRSMNYRIVIRRIDPSPKPDSRGAAGGSVISIPGNHRGALGPGAAETRFVVRCAKGEAFRIEAKALDGVAADLYLRLAGPDSKVIAKGDDHAGTADPVLAAVTSTDGEHVLTVGDHSGKSVSGKVGFILAAARQAPDFSLEIPVVAQVPVGGESTLEVKVARHGGFAGPVRIAHSGAPAWISLTGPTEIPKGAESVKLKLAAGKGAPADYGLIRFTATGEVGGRPVTVEGRATSENPGGMAPLGPAGTLCCAVLPPPFKARVVEADGGRRVNRGATHLAEISVERSAGFSGEIILDMAASQQRHRQGIRGEPIAVPPGTSRVEFPVFLPEDLETSRTSRIGLVAMAMVPDGAGKPRWALAPVEGQVTMSIEGALLKLSAMDQEMIHGGGEGLTARLRITRAPELSGPVAVSLAQGPKGASAPTVQVPAGRESVDIPVAFGTASEGVLVFRAETKRRGHPVVSEARIEVMNRSGPLAPGTGPIGPRSDPAGVSPRP